jgi:hypothetical protein
MTLELGQAVDCSKEDRMGNVNVNKVIEEFDQLPLEDKEYVAEVIRKQVIESRREKIAERAQEARSNFEEGRVKTGTLKELMEDLDSD